MQINAEQANRFYLNLPENLQYAHFSPEYICADAVRNKDLQPCFYLYEAESQFFYHGFHLSKIAEIDFYDIQSPYGYGGPITNSGNPFFLDKAWENYINWCKEKKILVEFIRFHPILQNYQQYQGKVMFNRYTVWIDLTNEDLLASYSTRARTAVKKAIKNHLRVCWCDQDEFLTNFIPLYNKAMGELLADDFYFFSTEYFQRIMEHNAHCALCVYDDQVVAGSIFLLQYGNMEYHLSAASPDGKKMNATNLLLHEAALLGKELGCNHLHLGGGTNAEAKNPLLFFKKSFSSSCGEFYIGKNIIFPYEYNQYREALKKENPALSNRILFYRK